MKHISTNIRVPIEKDNPSIIRIEERCIKCGQCANVCREFVSVNRHFRLSKTGNNAICVNCGQCIKVCPMNAIVEKTEYRQVKKAIADKEKIVIVSMAPSVRVGIGDEFGFKRGEFVEGKAVALLKKLGFDYVLDTNFGADLTICEEAQELITRLHSNKKLPQFTSCCPSWVKFVETFYPEFLPNLSTCKSPISMQGAIIKTYFAGKKKIDPRSIVNVTITPCVAKKFEIRRKELCASGKINKVRNMKDNDFIITTVELSKWAKEEGINLATLPEQKFDNLMGQSSGAGVIFGNTGGVMEAALRTAYSYLTGKSPNALMLNFKPVRGLEGIKECEVELAGKNLHLAAVYGLANARKVLEKIKQGQKYDFVEVMACPGGCIGGGGQPKHIGEEKQTQSARIKSLYNRDKDMAVRSSHKNPQIIKLYKDFLSTPNSDLAIKILHTMYQDRSGDLAVSQNVAKKEDKMIKYRCKVCGQIFEVAQGQTPVCPLCKMKGDKLERID